MNSINTIFQKNYSSDTERDNSLMKLAYEVTKAKKQKILTPNIASDDFRNKLKSWFQEKLNKENKSDPAAVLALEDITLLMTYLYNHEVLKNDTDITTQLITIVKDLDILIAPSINFQFGVIKQAIGKEDMRTLLDKIDKGMWKKKTIGADARGQEVEEFLKTFYIEELFGRLASQEDADNTRMFVFKIICEKMSKGEENNKANAKKCAAKFTKQYPELVLRIANENADYKELLKEYTSLAQEHSTITKKTAEFTSGANKSFDDIKKAIGAEDLKNLLNKVAEGKWYKTNLSRGKEVEKFLSDDYMKKLFGKAMSNSDLEKGKMVIFEIICEETLNINTTKKNKSKPQLDCIEKFKEYHKDLFEKIISERPELFKDQLIANNYITAQPLKDKVINSLNDFSSGSEGFKCNKDFSDPSLMQDENFVKLAGQEENPTTHIG